MNYLIMKMQTNFCIWFARKFPTIALWCFIVVYSEDGEAPGISYKNKYDFWKKRYKLKNF